MAQRQKYPARNGKRKETLSPIFPLSIRLPCGAPFLPPFLHPMPTPLPKSPCHHLISQTHSNIHATVISGFQMVNRRSEKSHFNSVSPLQCMPSSHLAQSTCSSSIPSSSTEYIVAVSVPFRLHAVQFPFPSFSRSTTTDRTRSLASRWHQYMASPPPWPLFLSLFMRILAGHYLPDRSLPRSTPFVRLRCAAATHKAW